MKTNNRFLRRDSYEEDDAASKESGNDALLLTKRSEGNGAARKESDNDPFGEDSTSYEEPENEESTKRRVIPFLAQKWHTAFESSHYNLFYVHFA